MPPISIIIPTLNEENYLPRLLDSIVSQHYDGMYEVIIVDGFSTDNTIAAIDRYKKTNFRLFKCQAGTSRQRNYGARKAKYSNLLFLDADTELTRDTLSKVATQFKSKVNFIAIPRIYPYDGKAIDVLLSLLAYCYFFIVRYRHPIVSGMCIITTNTVHNRINGFNTMLEHAEDIDYGLRAYRSGAQYRVLFNIKVGSSVRRLDKLGRIKTLRTWLKWHHNAVTNEYVHGENDDYTYGQFK